MKIDNEKIQFTDKPYEYVLKMVLLLLVFWNGYALILFLNKNTLFPIFLNGVILVLVMSRHKMTKRIVRWWSLIFFILAPAIVILSSAIISLDDLASPGFLLRYTKIIFGLFIFIGANRFIHKESIKDLGIGIEDHLVSSTKN